MRRHDISQVIFRKRATKKRRRATPNRRLLFVHAIFFVLVPKMRAHLMIDGIYRHGEAQRDARDGSLRRDIEKIVRLPAKPNARKHRCRDGSPDAREICGGPKPAQKLLATVFFIVRHAKGTGGVFRFPYR